MTPLRDPELTSQPNKFAGAQTVDVHDGLLHFKGYQDFTLDPRTREVRACESRLEAKESLLAGVLRRRYMAGRSVLDLGGNNGFFALKALQAGATSATVVDIDPDCVRNIKAMRSYVPDL